MPPVSEVGAELPFTATLVNAAVVLVPSFWMYTPPVSELIDVLLLTDPPLNVKVLFVPSFCT